MRQHSGNNLFIVALVTGTLGYSSGAEAGCTPSVTSTSNYGTCIGSGALYYNTTGVFNTSVGAFSLYANSTGYGNTSVGYNALNYNQTGYYNSAIGYYALYFNNTGSSNVAVGSKAGYNLTTGSNNVDIANTGVAGDSGVIRIGTQGTQTKTFLAGVYGSAVTGSAVLVNSSGQLGVLKSSRRYKEDIKPMGSVSDKLLELRPVTFHYKKADEDGRKPIQYGLIAEEVDAIMPELVVRNKDGSPETVAYQYIPSLLINEYQKQHKELVAEKAELSETKAKMAEMQSQIDKLNAITKKLMAALPATTKTAMAK